MPDWSVNATALLLSVSQLGLGLVLSRAITSLKVSSGPEQTSFTSVCEHSSGASYAVGLWYYAMPYAAHVGRKTFPAFSRA